jgi:hypothetical protein
MSQFSGSPHYARFFVYLLWWLRLWVSVSAMLEIFCLGKNLSIGKNLFIVITLYRTGGPARARLGQPDNNNIYDEKMHMHDYRTNLFVTLFETNKGHNFYFFKLKLFFFILNLFMSL